MDDGMASDVGSGALMANAGAKAAAYNVRINLKSIKNEKFCKATGKDLEKLIDECNLLTESVTQNVDKTL
jgi:formiminotetrahydrofolate cyclodeaminase